MDKLLAQFQQSGDFNEETNSLYINGTTKEELLWLKDKYGGILRKIRYEYQKISPWDRYQWSTTKKDTLLQLAQTIENKRDRDIFQHI